MSAVATPSNDGVMSVARLEPLRPMPIHQVQSAMGEYQAGLQALLVDSDWQAFSDRGGEVRRFVKRSGWRKIATWFGLDLLIGDVVLERDEHGQLLRARVTARAVAPNGRVFEDVGACSHSERRFSKPEHDILATAATRAHNRATSDLVGMGEVSSDEMLEPELAEPILPDWAENANSESVDAMYVRLVALVGDERARLLVNAIGTRYDGVPNVVTGIITALHSMLAPKEPATETTETTETTAQPSGGE
jgi:hypothetical protein